MALQLEIIFGKGNGQITLNSWDGNSLEIKDDLAAKGWTASFNASIRQGDVMPELDSLCLIREVTGSGYTSKFLGRYEQEAIEIKAGPWNFSFTINLLIDFTHRDEIEDYSEDTTLVNHINNALELSDATEDGRTLSLLALQSPIPGDDGETFQHDFKLGSLEAFLDSLMGKIKGRWKIKFVPFTDYEAKISGSYGLIEVIIDGATENRAAPDKLNPLISSCPNNDYLRFMGSIKENRKPPMASRFVCNGRNGRKLTED